MNVPLLIIYTSFSIFVLIAFSLDLAKLILMKPVMKVWQVGLVFLTIIAMVSGCAILILGAIDAS